MCSLFVLEYWLLPTAFQCHQLLSIFNEWFCCFFHPVLDRLLTQTLHETRSMNEWGSLQSLSLDYLNGWYIATIILVFFCSIDAFIQSSWLSGKYPLDVRFLIIFPVIICSQSMISEMFDIALILLESMITDLD